MVRDALRDYNHETRKSKELAAREAEVEARAYAAWVDARGKGDWEAFSPIMEEVKKKKNARLDTKHAFNKNIRTHRHGWLIDGDDN